ncbi:MAG: zf-HC2 domain-containing protein [Nitrospirota bacterium]|nr:zf-HC2 domain-containing protein [Nitrospirota bacterium]MDH5767810.1 zf-HC2 domain-containing protein [Nitrospirota bacterium]
MKLDHDRIKEMLPDYLKGSIPKEMRSEFETHLKDCENCRGELSFITEMMKVEVPEPGDLFWQMLPRRVKGIVEEEKAKRFSLTSIFFRPLPIAATISVLLLLVITYTTTMQKKEIKEISEVEPFSSPFSVAVVDYSDISEKDIPIIEERLDVNGEYLQTGNLLEFSYYREFASLSSKEMESLYEVLNKEQRNGG